DAAAAVPVNPLYFACFNRKKQGAAPVNLRLRPCSWCAGRLIPCLLPRDNRGPPYGEERAQRASRLVRRSPKGEGGTMGALHRPYRPSVFAITCSQRSPSSVPAS